MQFELASPACRTILTLDPGRHFGRKLSPEIFERLYHAACTSASQQGCISIEVVLVLMGDAASHEVVVEFEAHDVEFVSKNLARSIDGLHLSWR